MMRSLSTMGDRMLARLVPELRAAATSCQYCGVFCVACVFVFPTNFSRCIATCHQVGEDCYTEWDCTGCAPDSC